MKIKFKKLHKDAIIPKYQTKGSAGFDIHALEDYKITDGCTYLIRTGLSVEIPEGYELQIRTRSGMALKNGLVVLNSPGTVDSDYRGEIGVIIYSANPYYEDSNYFLKKGDRIAQGVVCKVEQPEILVVEELSETERGEGGFGSTGK